MKNYFEWLVENTRTVWWHDSADPSELQFSLANGASGVTTNPVLIAEGLRQNGLAWKDELVRVFGEDLSAKDRATELTGVVVQNLATCLSSLYQKRGNSYQGYVCAQVNPGLMADRDAMLSTAKRYASLAPNISVKVPATSSGLEVAEACVAEGISVTVTVSFTVAQAVAIGKMYDQALTRAAAKNIAAGTCCAVLMIGRIDDYIRNIAWDTNPKFDESDIRQAGIAIAKRTYKIYMERGYTAKLCIAALRGPYHMTEMAGADLIMSVHPKQQYPFLSLDIPREARIDVPVDANVLERLSSIQEFRKAYEPEGLGLHEFLSYGATQCTISQFIESGWKRIESFKIEDCK